MSNFEDYENHTGKVTFAKSILGYLGVTVQNLKEILVVGFKWSFFIFCFTVIGGGFGYLLATHPTVWVRVIVGGIMIICFIIWTTLWNPQCSYNRRRYMGMNKH